MAIKDCFLFSYFVFCRVPESQWTVLMQSHCWMWPTSTRLNQWRWCVWSSFLDRLMQQTAWVTTETQTCHCGFLWVIPVLCFCRHFSTLRPHELSRAEGSSRGVFLSPLYWCLQTGWISKSGHCTARATTAPGQTHCLLWDTGTTVSTKILYLKQKNVANWNQTRPEI